MVNSQQMKKETGVVSAQQEIGYGIFDMWIETTLAKTANAGQFVSVYPKNGSTILPRPISICQVDKENEKIRLVYRVAGKGTKEFSNYHAGETLSLLGVLGNGFDISKAKGKKVVLMGGGIGIPPMLQLAKELFEANTEISIYLGYRDGQLFLKEELEAFGQVYIATEDGSVGCKGNVMDALKESGVIPELIYSCGPMPMLRAIKNYSEQQDIEAYISLEEKMACGVGACLGCVCKTKEIDDHSRVKNARICTDGPVYLAKEVDI